MPASAAEAPDLARARQLVRESGTTVDRRLTDTAAWVPTVSLRDVELTSGRLGNYEYNPVLGFLADQSWIR